MTRLLLLTAGCFVCAVALAQSLIEPISGWKQQEQNGKYIFTPNAASEKDFSYKIMPLVKGNSSNIGDWLKQTATKEIQASGYKFSEKDKIFTLPIFSYHTFAVIVTDATGKRWSVNYMAYKKTDGAIRYASFTLPEEMEGTSTGIATNHFFKLADKEGNSQSTATVNPATGNKVNEDKPVTKKEIPATPVQGIKKSTINGVVMNMEYGYGVGGGMIIEYNPYLLLNDGSIYKYPEASPYDLDIAASKQTEPKKWGNWKAEGKTMVVQFIQKDGTKKTSRWERNWFWTTPATASEKLTGSYQSISGTGNTALGGTAMVIAARTITFNNKGQFTFVSFAGSSNSDGGVGVTAYSSKDEAGTYVLDGYSISLKFNNGKTLRRLFYFYPDSHQHFGMGGSVYLPVDK